MKFRYNDTESVKGYKNSSYSETIKEIGNKLVPQKIGEVLNMPVWEFPNGDGGGFLTPLEFALLVANGEIQTWNIFKTTYSIKLGQYLRGRSVPINKRVGSSRIPESGKKQTGKINGQEVKMLFPSKNDVEKK